MTRMRIGAVLLTAFVLLASGCGGGGDGGLNFNNTLAPAPAPAAAQGTISGVVMDAVTGSGIAGATVQAGTVTATTGAGGTYSLQVTAADGVVLNVRANGFADGLSTTGVAANDTSSATTRLLPVGVSATVDNTAGGTVTDPNSSAQVILPAGAFGSATSVRVDLTVVRPAQDPAQMPGDFLTDTGQPIESAGAIIVTPRDANGNVLQLAAGKSATIRIPLSTRGEVPQSIPLFFLNPQTGRWVQEGTGTLGGTAPNQYYEGTVTHFSTWNADRTYDTIRVKGCVQNSAGTKLARVLVLSDGIDYSGASSALTDAAGNFSVPIKKDARAALTGIQAGRLTNSLSVGPSATDITLSTCLVLGDVNNSVTIRLTWGQTPRDVDSYLFTPSGARINFQDEGSLGTAPFAALDVDDTTSFGPEVVTITKLMVGTYTYGVHNFSGETAPNMTASPVRVELNVAGRVQVFTLPPGETADTKFVRLFNLNVDANCHTTVVPVNTWEADAPPAPATTTAPAFCTP